MSILDYLKEYSKDYKPPSIAWRERRVWHRTKTGEMHFVKIKSLTPDEQMKYKPMDLIKKRKKAKKYDNAKKRKPSGGMPMAAPQPEPEKVIEGELFDFYYGVKDPKEYDKFKKGDLVIGTLDSSRAVDFEDDEDLHVVFVANVPIDAVKEYMDEEGDWQKIDITDKDKKAEFIKFDETDFFKLDLLPFKDDLNFELQDDVEDDEDEETKEESSSDYKSYIIEKYLMYHFKNKTLSLIKEVGEPITEEEQLVFDIANDLGIRFDGFLDPMELHRMGNAMADKYKDSAFFTDPKSGTTLMVILKEPKEDWFRQVKEHVEKSRAQHFDPKTVEKLKQTFEPMVD